MNVNGFKNNHSMFLKCCFWYAQMTQITIYPIFYRCRLHLKGNYRILHGF